MRDILPELTDLIERGEAFALSTVVRTWSSSPRPVGAAMTVSARGQAVGSVSGGCVEGAVYEVAQEVLEGGAPQLVLYGVADENAYATGLTCGGSIELFVQRADDAFRADIRRIADAVDEHVPIGLAMVVAGPDDRLGRRLVVTEEDATGSLGGAELDAAVAAQVRSRMAVDATGSIELALDGTPLGDTPADEGGATIEDAGGVRVFIDTFLPPRRMIVIGAIDFAEAVTRMGKFLGYHVTVCDPRPIFATRERFPYADEVVVKWPHLFLDEITMDDRTALAILTHDKKFDVPLLSRALRRPAQYIGWMGSRHLLRELLASLREHGMTEEEIARMHAPIGLDLGARTPEETAVSIAAEIVSVACGGTGQKLRSVTDSESIHRGTLASESGPAPEPVP